MPLGRGAEVRPERPLAGLGSLLAWRVRPGRRPQAGRPGSGLRQSPISGQFTQVALFGYLGYYEIRIELSLSPMGLVIAAVAAAALLEAARSWMVDI